MIFIPSNQKDDCLLTACPDEWRITRTWNCIRDSFIAGRFIQMPFYLFRITKRSRFVAIRKGTEALFCWLFFLNFQNVVSVLLFPIYNRHLDFIWNVRDLLPYASNWTKILRAGKTAGKKNTEGKLQLYIFCLFLRKFLSNLRCCLMLNHSDITCQNSNKSLVNERGTPCLISSLIKLKLHI